MSVSSVSLFVLFAITASFAIVLEAWTKMVLQKVTFPNRSIKWWHLLLMTGMIVVIGASFVPSQYHAVSLGASSVIYQVCQTIGLFCVWLLLRQSRDSLLVQSQRLVLMGIAVASIGIVPAIVIARLPTANLLDPKANITGLIVTLLFIWSAFLQAAQGMRFHHIEERLEKRYLLTSVSMAAMITTILNALVFFFKDEAVSVVFQGFILSCILITEDYAMHLLWSSMNMARLMDFGPLLTRIRSLLFVTLLLMGGLYGILMR